MLATIETQTPIHSVLIDSDGSPPRFEILFKLTTQLEDPIIQSTQDTTGEHSSSNQRRAEDEDIFDDGLTVLIAEKFAEKIFHRCLINGLVGDSPTARYRLSN